MGASDDAPRGGRQRGGLHADGVLRAGPGAGSRGPLSKRRRDADGPREPVSPDESARLKAHRGVCAGAALGVTVTLPSCRMRTTAPSNPAARISYCDSVADITGVN